MPKDTGKAERIQQHPHPVVPLGDKMVTDEKTVENDKFFIAALKDGWLRATENGEVFNLKTGNQIGKPSSQGYGIVVLIYNGVRYTTTTHRIIWLAFNGLIPIGFNLNHKNGKKNDSSLKNLELTTDSENVQHAYKNGLVDTKALSARSKEQRELDLLFVESLRIKFATGKYSAIAIKRMIYKETGKIYSKSGVLAILKGSRYNDAGGPLNDCRVLIAARSGGLSDEVVKSYAPLARRIPDLRKKHGLEKTRRILAVRKRLFEKIVERYGS